MSTGPFIYRVLTSFSEVRSYLPGVVRAADSDKDALGFFAESVFMDFARKDLLFVLLVKEDSEEVYGGHLLFDVRFPKAHVRQVFVEERFRRRKLGNVLLDTLKHHLTELQFISIHARVAEDLREANSFWERQDFYPQRIEAGGASKKRMIVVRAHELSASEDGDQMYGAVLCIFSVRAQYFLAPRSPAGKRFKRDIAKIQLTGKSRPEAGIRYGYSPRSRP